MSPDTNVLVRLIVKDDAGQFQAADAAWREALSSGGIHISKVALVETVWVLRKAYKFDRRTVARTLHAFISVKGVSVEDSAEVLRALDVFEDGHADFADYVILESARSADALPVATFDEGFAAIADVSLLPGHPAP